MRDKAAFWDGRATLGEAAGTDDVILKRLEIAQLLQRVPAGSSVLDVGCGNGLSLLALAQHRECVGLGIDKSEPMIAEAQRQVPHGMAVNFTSAAMCSVTVNQYDVAITERCLINLGDARAQVEMFRGIMQCLKPGGCYLMFENSHEGLARLNAMRALVDLPPMMPPWHNVYLHEQAIRCWANDELVLEEVVPFASTYFFLSRVVYAAVEKGTLAYESAINLLALKLPSFGDLGATRLWVWRRR